MEEYKIDYKFNLEDFETMESIEHAYFLENQISPAEEVLKWYKKNNLTCVGVRNKNNEVIANVSILPLKKKVFYDIYENRMNESEVVYSQIEKYEDNKAYYLYLSSISINKAYINNYQIVTKLLTGCINLFDILMIRNIRIKEIMADASTIHGEKICRKLLKMNYITNTDHKSKIYCVDGKNFLETMKNIKQFIK